MAEFYVDKDENEAGQRLVHSSACTELPAEDTMIYLGAFSNSETAVRKADNRHFNVAPCPSCIKAKAPAETVEETSVAA